MADGHVGKFGGSFFQHEILPALFENRPRRFEGRNDGVGFGRAVGHRGAELARHAVDSLLDVVRRIGSDLVEHVVLEPDVVHLRSQQQVVDLFVNAELCRVDGVQPLPERRQTLRLLAHDGRVVGDAFDAVRGPPGPRPKQRAPERPEFVGELDQLAGIVPDKTGMLCRPGRGQHEKAERQRNTNLIKSGQSQSDHDRVLRMDTHPGSHHRVRCAGGAAGCRPVVGAPVSRATVLRAVRTRRRPAP